VLNSFFKRCEKIPPIEKWSQIADARTFLKTQMKFNGNLRTLHKNLKMNKILKGHFKKLRLISGGSIISGLFNHTTFNQLLSRVHVPLRGKINVLVKVTEK